MLGTSDFDASPYGKEERHLRHFFHLTVEGFVPDRWLHYERAASEEQFSAIAFELFWLPIEEAARSLDFGHGALLTLVDSAK